MKVLILGGGITGLSTAWHLKKKNPQAKITLLEKENRLGGWIQTSHEGGFLFEKGPRTFQKGRSPHLLRLIEELKLEVIPSDPSARRRFILHHGKLRTPESFLPMFAFTFLRELFVSKSNQEDESIYEFASRRFSSKVAELFFDPLTLGIYAGDIRKLSIRACFPALYQWEQQKGSVIRGFFSSSKKAKGLFTLKGGMETLIQTLAKRLNIDFVLNCPVETISQHEVFAGGKTWGADHVISALPPNLPYKSIWVVHLAFSQNVLPKKGFGYLVPSKEKEGLLGCVFDSAIFPEPKKETRLTAMVRSECESPLETALDALSRHLKIRTQPVYTSAFLAKHAIPQFEVGCKFSEGVSVDACVQRGASLAASV